MTDDEKVEAVARAMGPLGHVTNENGRTLWDGAARRLLDAPGIHVTVDPPPPDPVVELAYRLWAAMWPQLNRWMFDDNVANGSSYANALLAALRAEVDAGRLTIGGAA